MGDEAQDIKQGRLKHEKPELLGLTERRMAKGLCGAQGSLDSGIRGTRVNSASGICIRMAVARLHPNRTK